MSAARDDLRTLRPIYMKSNVNTKASGSAYIEHERTKVMCSVYGPRTATGRGEFSETGRVVCDVRFAPFATRVRRERTQTSQEKEMSSALRAALEPAIQLDRFPKSVVEVFVVILESDGGDLGVAISCASMAVANAGIDMFDLVAGCTVVQRQRDGAGAGAAGELSAELVLDPTSEDIEQADASLSCALMPTLRQVTHLVQEGEMDLQEISEATEFCLDGCAQVSSMIRSSFKQSTT